MKRLQPLAAEAWNAPARGEAGRKIVEEILLRPGVTSRDDDLPAGHPTPRVNECASAFGKRLGLLRPEPGQRRGLGDLTADGDKPWRIQLGDTSNRLLGSSGEGLERRSAESVNGWQHHPPLLQLGEFVAEEVEDTVPLAEIPTGRDHCQVRQQAVGGSRVRRVHRARKADQIGELADRQRRPAAGGQPVWDAVPFRLVAGQPGAHLRGLGGPFGELELGGLVAEQIHQAQLEVPLASTGRVKIAGERLKRAGLGVWFDAGDRVHDGLDGGTELTERGLAGAEHRDRQVTQLRGYLVAKHPKGLLVVRGDQHPLTVGNQMADKVRDRVALARTRRALHRDAPGPREPDSDTLLIVIRGQRHEQALPDRRPAVVARALAGAGRRAVAVVRHDRGKRLGEEVALRENLAQLRVETAIQRRTWPDEQDPRVGQHRGRGRGRHLGTGRDPRVKAERRDNLRIQIGQAVIRPGIRRDPPYPLPQCRQFLHRREPQQRVGLQRGQPVRQDRQHPGVRVHLDGHGGEEQRMVDGLPCRQPRQHTVAPHQLVPRVVPL